MKILKEFLKNFGIISVKSKLPFDYNVSDYKIKDGDKIKTHKEFLKSIEAEENNRLSIIENKTAQLVAQTGIIFSLFSLFIPIFIDKLTGQPILIRTLFVTLLALTFIFYMLTIRNAIKNFDVKRFIYSKPHPKNVIKYQDETINEFTAIEVKDLLFSANQNLKSNNDKATNLILSYNSFKVANMFLGALGIFICCSLLFAKPEKNIVTIESPITIQHINTNHDPQTMKKENKDTLHRTRKDTLNMTKNGLIP